MERSWLFDSERWLSVKEGDGQVERKLRVCSGEMHPVKVQQVDADMKPVFF